MTSQERREERYQRRKTRRIECKQMRKQSVGNVEEIFTYHDMYKYGKTCCNNVRFKTSTINFESRLFSGTAVRRRAIINDKWKSKKYSSFQLYERGKLRDIDAPHISDRQVHKTLNQNALLPLYKPEMIYDNGASMVSKGLKFSYARLKQHLCWYYRRYGTDGWIISLDLKSFFPSAPHDIILAKHKRLLVDDRVCKIADSIVYSVPTGIPIGVELSQTEMVSLPSPVDNYIKCQLGIHCAAHYMDDYYIIVRTKEEAKCVLSFIIKKFEQQGLTVNMSKTKIQPLSKPFRFCKAKFQLLDNGRIIVHGSRDGMKRAKKRLKMFKHKYNNGEITRREIKQTLNCFMSYYKKFNDHGRILKLNRMYYAMFEEGNMGVQYIVTKRFKKMCADGKVRNLPYGTKCESDGEFIKYDNNVDICAITSQDAYDYFSRDDDGNGKKRGKLVHEIIKTLAKTDDKHQERWNRIWDSQRFYRFKQDIDDYWLWNYDFYNAHIYDLEDILRTVKGV